MTPLRYTVSIHQQGKGKTVYTTIEQIINTNKEKGFHFFSKETLAFWRGRVHAGVIGGCYFVTSERDFSDTQRLYTIRKANTDGTIDTVGDFQAYATLAQAKRAMRKLA